MKYQEGKIGRVYILKFDNGDDFKSEITHFCEEKDIKAGQIQFLGAIKKSNVVVGPQKSVIPPKPVWKDFDEAHEVVGYGTIAWGNDKPVVHLHTVFSRKDKAFIGCIRNMAEVYLIIEAVIIELADVDIKREIDQDLGVTVLRLNDNSNA